MSVRKRKQPGKMLYFSHSDKQRSRYWIPVLSEKCLRNPGGDVTPRCLTNPKWHWNSRSPLICYPSGLTSVQEAKRGNTGYYWAFHYGHMSSRLLSKELKFSPWDPKMLYFTGMYNIFHKLLSILLGRGVLRYMITLYVIAWLFLHCF